MKPSKQFLSLLMFFLLKANHTKNANVQLPCYNKSASVYITLSVWMSDKVTLRHGKGTFKMMRLDQKFHRWHTQHILKQQTHLKPLEKPNLLQHRKLFFWTIQRVSKSCEKKKASARLFTCKIGIGLGKLPITSCRCSNPTVSTCQYHIQLGAMCFTIPSQPECLTSLAITLIAINGTHCR